MVHVIATQIAPASPEAIWALLADAAGWHRWTPLDETTLERPGAPEPDGVGAIRRFRTGRLVNREEVVVFDAPRQLGYVLVSGLPLRDYRADFTLTKVASGTEIRWEARFLPPMWGTGWIYAFMLERFLKKALAGLSEAAGRSERVAA